MQRGDRVPAGVLQLVIVAHLQTTRERVADASPRGYRRDRAPGLARAHCSTHRSRAEPRWGPAPGSGRTAGESLTDGADHGRHPRVPGPMSQTFRASHHSTERCCHWPRPRRLPASQPFEARPVDRRSPNTGWTIPTVQRSLSSLSRGPLGTCTVVLDGGCARGIRGPESCRAGLRTGRGSHAGQAMPPQERRPSGLIN